MPTFSEENEPFYAVSELRFFLICRRSPKPQEPSPQGLNLQWLHV